jgi:hypothetical protein
VATTDCKLVLMSCHTADDILRIFPWDAARRIFVSPFINGSALTWDVLLLSAFADCRTVIKEWMVIRKVSPVVGDLSDVVVGSARKKGILARATLYKDGQYYDVISTAFLYYCTQFESERSLLASFARAMVAADPLQGPAQTLLSLSSAVTTETGAANHGDDRPSGDIQLPDRSTLGAWLRICVERDLQGAAAAPAWSPSLAGGSPCVTVANQLLYERRLALHPQAGYSPYSQYTAAYAALYAQHAAAVGAAQLQQMQAPQPTTQAPQPGREQQPLTGIKRRASDPGLAQLQQRPRQSVAAVSSGAGSSSSSSSARLRESRGLKQEQLNSPGVPTSPASTGSSQSSSGAGGPLPAPPRRQSLQQSSSHPREPQAGEDLYLSSTAGTSRRQKKNKEKYCLTIQVLGCDCVAVCYCAADFLPLSPLHCAADHRRGRPGVAPLPQPGS